MIKILLKTSVLIASMAMVFGSCSKDNGDDPSSGSATNGKTTAIFRSGVTYGTMTDQDGDVYKTVTIGTQTWMAENLRTTKYNDGKAISNVKGAIEWSNLTTGAYCNYKNTTNADTIATFGRLYNWYAVNTGKLAPTGWHVSTDADWTTLTDYLGGESIAGDKLKETGTTHWINPSTNATNETGFTALSGGYRGIDGLFTTNGSYGSWWSANESNNVYAWYRAMIYNQSFVYHGKLNYPYGYSVRCVRD